MKKCNTPGKLAFNTRKEAYEQTLQFKNTKPYECKCGKYHLTHKKKQ